MGTRELPLLVSLLLCAPDLLPSSRETSHTALGIGLAQHPEQLGAVQVSRESCPKQLRAHLEEWETAVTEGEGICDRRQRVDSEGNRTAVRAPCLSQESEALAAPSALGTKQRPGGRGRFCPYTPAVPHCLTLW